MTAKKPSHSEEEFIAKQEAVERHRAAVAKMQAMAEAERVERQRLHHMKCPKCGMDLATIVYRGVGIDKCFTCNGTWLDAGELEQLAGKGHDVLHGVIDFFRR